MRANVFTYNTEGEQLAPRQELSSHIAWEEKPPVVNLEILLEPGKLISIEIPVFEIELEIKRHLGAQRLGPC